MTPPADPATPRTVLVTGPGGAGRTTVAAATALAAGAPPAAGQQSGAVLLLSTEPQRVLQPLLGAEPGRGPQQADAARVAPGVWAARLDPAERFRARAVELQQQAGSAFELLGAEPLDEDELTELPGAEALTLLHALRTARDSSDWHTIVVDLPPVRQALGLLALPAQLQRYLRRLLPQERQAARALRPVLAQLAGVPMPTQWLYDSAARWSDELRDIQRAVESAGTELRLVAEPGPQAAQQLAEARAGCALYGVRPAVVANRLFPTGSSDPWLTALCDQQQAALHELRADCTADGVPLYELPHLGRAPLGIDDLSALGDRCSPPTGASSSAHPASSTPTPPADTASADAASDTAPPVLGRLEDRRAQDGLLVWLLPLPGARKDELGLVRRGDELLVTTGPFRRALPLPSALRRCRVAGAALEEGELRVRFAPDPALWPS